MTNIKLILTIIILSSVFLGCVVPTEPAGTPAPTPPATPTVTATVKPTYTPAPLPTPSPAIRKSFPVTYKVWIDSDYGFVKARAVNGTTNVPLPSDFDILNLSINVGDRVIWINDDSYDWPLTVISREGLWTNRSGYLRYNYQKFGYTFNKSGTYTVSIKEYSRKQQKIVVNP